ncbi:hypothetical protein [Anoxybacteroides amylolyticum]|uniref:hypothetical protein n=1 Tax=Anoxybacteroides amylolyticum TaxID=294699 RepID=UPI0008357090|nr:hypothetical protein [Anoxybacillus amylolyticus]
MLAVFWHGEIQVVIFQQQNRESALLEVVPALYQVRVVANIWAIEVIVFIVVAASLVWVRLAKI